METEKEEKEIKIYATADMRISDLLQAHPMAYRALLECGMGCVTCPSAMYESVEEACMVHGLDPEDVMDYVNHVLAEEEEKTQQGSDQS